MLVCPLSAHRPLISDQTMMTPIPELAGFRMYHTRGKPNPETLNWRSMRERGFPELPDLRVW